MKIEKISDSQIRCTLSKEDLMDRELRLSELAYGTEKAKALFRDMMQQASYEFGFEADDLPLMIEAIPISSECLVLVITKVEDPDELDTRFSKFSSAGSDSEDSIVDEENETTSDDILNCFDKLSSILSEDNEIEIQQEREDAHTKEDVANAKEVNIPVNPSKVFIFQTLDDVIAMSSILVGIYHGENTLYKDSINHRYYLTIHRSSHTAEEYNRICNLISEFGNPAKSTYATTDYFEEHFEVIVKDSAIQILSVMQNQNERNEPAKNELFLAGSSFLEQINP